ncbi:MAG TPA: DUF1697 domain-containing protein [Streptosporangiaceae bacterium]|nr:DUF1697 domain-containing protein [Streptosporangiaceae bacterium]
MPTHVALLRGINVGGGGKVPMAELRELVSSLGHAEVVTYIQTGNVIFSPSHDDTVALAAELHEAIAASFGVHSAVVVLSRARLADVIRANPYPDEPNPKFVHGVFLLADPDETAHGRVADTVDLVAGKGSRDEAVIIGRTLYLHTPDGFGTSDLARELTLKKRSNPLAEGTARNWATITKLLALCDG